MPQSYAAYRVPSTHFVAGVDLDAMRDLIQRRRPATTAEALRMLREAYPTAPLRLRIAACEG